MKKLKTKVKELEETEKQEKGVTLIALIVTIVVLLILAGVTIATLTGNNGIVTRANQAKTETQQAEDKELIRLAVSEARIGENEFQKLNANSLQKAIDNQFDKRNAVVSDNGDGTFIVSCLDTLKDYKVTSNSVESTLDWNKAMANAVAPESQDEARNEGVIGIGTDGQPVDMDNWDYIVLDNGTFGLHCINLSDFPIIPNGVTNLTSAFANTAIVTMPEIPDSVTIMNDTFGNCTNLINFKSLPKNLENAMSCFKGCTNLKIAPQIPSKVTNMSNTFYNCTALQEIPYIPEGVMDMTSTFQGCTNLTNIDIKIPSSVKNLSHTFREDTNLSGKITIEATPDKYENCFYHTSTNINTELIISGPEESRDILIQIIGTKSNKSNIKGDWN